jgi:hypothetical protein
MADREPVETTNLDQYGDTALEWSRARDALAAKNDDVFPSFFLGTVTPEGRPHAAGIGAVWHDGDVYVVAGPGTRKARNLEANPACTVSVSLPGMDLVLEGDASRVVDTETLERLAAVYRAERRASAVEPVPRRGPHGLRRRERRALGGNSLAVRRLTAAPGWFPPEAANPRPTSYTGVIGTGGWPTDPVPHSAAGCPPSRRDTAEGARSGNGWGCRDQTPPGNGGTPRGGHRPASGRDTRLRKRAAGWPHSVEADPGAPGRVSDPGTASGTATTRASSRCSRWRYARSSAPSRDGS